MLDNNPLVDTQFFVPEQISRRILYHAQQLDYLYLVEKRYDAKEHMGTHDGLAEVLGRCIAYATELGSQARTAGNIVFASNTFDQKWDVMFPVHMPAIPDYTLGKSIRLTPSFTRIYGEGELDATQSVSFVHRLSLRKKTIEKIDELTATHPHKLANDKFMREAFAFYEMLWWHTKHDRYFCSKVNGLLQNNNKLKLLQYQ